MERGKRPERRQVYNDPPRFDSTPCCTARDLACSFVLGLVGAAGAAAVARLAKKTRKVILLSSSGGFVAGTIAGKVFGHCCPAQKKAEETRNRDEVENQHDDKGKKRKTAVADKVLKLIANRGEVEKDRTNWNAERASRRIYATLRQVSKLENGKSLDESEEALLADSRQAFAWLDEIKWLDVTGPKITDHTASQIVEECLQSATNLTSLTIDDTCWTALCDKNKPHKTLTTLNIQLANALRNDNHDFDDDIELLIEKLGLLPSLTSLTLRLPKCVEEEQLERLAEAIPRGLQYLILELENSNDNDGYQQFIDSLGQRKNLQLTLGASNKPVQATYWKGKGQNVAKNFQHFSVWTEGRTLYNWDKDL